MEDLKDQAQAMSFDVEDMEKAQRLKPVQDKLDSKGRSIEVIEYTNVRSKASFKCKVCDNVWEVKKAKYVTQQVRNCPKCHQGGRPSRNKGE